MDGSVDKWASLARTEPWVPFPAPDKPGAVTWTCNPSTKEGETGGPGA